MTKKFNFEEVKEKAVRLADKHLEEGLEEIQEDAKDTSGTGTIVPSETAHMEPVPAVSAAASVPAQATVVRTARMFHKERTQDVLVHCPESLHRRLRERKDHLWDEYGERVTINNMVIEAIALWLDVQEGKCKVSATT